MYTQDNDYGCAKHNGVSDMTVGKSGTLAEQLEKSGKSYQRADLSMGSLFAEPAYLVHYATKAGTPFTVLVIPAVGADSWAEEYYHFPGMSQEDAATLDWHAVYEHVHAVSTQTTMSKIHVAQKCPHCGKLEGVDGGKYDDIRGKSRCQSCHNLWN